MTTEGLSAANYVAVKNSKFESFFAFVGIALIGVIIILSTVLVKGLITSSDSFRLRSISVSNISDTSLTISWGTNKVADGYVVFGTTAENLNKKAFDNSAPQVDQIGFKSKRHAVTLTSLNPNTYYYYAIFSGSKIFEGAEGNIFDPVKTAAISPFFENSFLK